MYNWNLAENNFSFLDRLKICKFFLTKSNRWTQDKYVREYEKIAAEYVGCKYAVFVSSGSTANQLICQKIKDDLIKSNNWPRKNKVIVNAVTWQTNVSPYVREGFEPVFIDVNLNDFCLDYVKLEKYLEANKDTIACVFPTAVLGFTPDINKLKLLEKKFKSHNIKFAIDCCENFMGEYKDKNICNSFTSSTSCFVAHQISTGQEGGFIFTNNIEEYQYYLLSRAHGLLRNLIPYKDKLPAGLIDSLSNPLVDKQFDFQVLSSNYRGSDTAAYCGILDFKRVYKYKNHRNYIYSFFKNYLNPEKYYLPERRKNILDCAFCLPIIVQNNDINRLNKVKKLLDDLKIERRSFISGNMLRQLPYKEYGVYNDYENAEYLNNLAIYIGLNQNTTEEDIIDLCKYLNEI